MLRNIMSNSNSKFVLSVFTAASLITAVVSTPVVAEEMLPRDNGLSDYHSAPEYRESESHPLRIVGYILHPIGWVLREGIFRPLSYFASSTPETRSVMGYRGPNDYRDPYCFNNVEVPNCGDVVPFNYEKDCMGAGCNGSAAAALNGGIEDGRNVFFPNVNFDFNKKKLSPLGQAQARQVADVVKNYPGNLRIVLQGHTDKRGSETYNSKLGMDRAIAVRDELVRLGVSSERLTTVSFGEAQPIYTDETESAYAANRRVETRIEEQ